MRFTLIAASLAITTAPAFAQTVQTPPPPPPAAAPNSAAAPLSTADTLLGDLLDNPAAKAIIAKHIPGLVDNDQIDMARGMTLRAIQNYAPDDVTDERLAAIDADLAKLPPAPAAPPAQ